MDALRSLRDKPAYIIAIGASGTAILIAGLTSVMLGGKMCKEDKTKCLVRDMGTGLSAFAVALMVLAMVAAAMRYNHYGGFQNTIGGPEDLDRWNRADDARRQARAARILDWSGTGLRDASRA